MVAREEGSEDLLWTGLYSRGSLAGRLAGQGATRIWLFAFSRSLARSLAATREMQGRATGQVAGTGEPEGNGKRGNMTNRQAASCTSFASKTSKTRHGTPPSRQVYKCRY